MSLTGLSRKRRSELRIDFTMRDQRQDLVTVGVTVALRFGVLSD